MSVCRWIFTCNRLSFVDSVGVQCGLKCAVCHVFFISHSGLLISGHLFMSLRVFLCQFWVTFSVSFELHFRSVLSCMCTVVCRPQLRTSWRRRCQRKEDAGGSHGGAGTVTPNQWVCWYTHKCRDCFRHNLSSALLTFCTSGISDRGRKRPGREFDHDALSEQVTSESKPPNFSLKQQFSCFILHQIGCLCFFFRMKDESSSSDEDHRSSNQASGSCQSELLVSSGSVYYKKTLRLTSEQLVCVPRVGFIDVYGIKEVKTRSEVTHYTPQTWFTMTKL